MLGNLNNLVNWFLFSFFVMGSLGGVTYFVRLMFWHEKRVEVHHRYMQMPVYYGGFDPAEGRDFSVYGRPGDMAQHEAKDEESVGGDR